jgi:rRNA maturation RNase YbeY
MGNVVKSAVGRAPLRVAAKQRLAGQWGSQAPPEPNASRRFPSISRLELAISAMSAGSTPLIPNLRRSLGKAHRLLKSPLRELSIALVGAKQMSELHHEFLGLTGPTDVLTFELDHDSRGRITSGEIAICVPVARRQARARGGKTEHEVLLYALHGLLHLCGYDDRTESGFQAMHRREDHILAELGIGPVFNPAPDRSLSGAD